MKVTEQYFPESRADIISVVRDNLKFIRAVNKLLQRAAKAIVIRFFIPKAVSANKQKAKIKQLY